LNKRKKAFQYELDEEIEIKNSWIKSMVKNKDGIARYYIGECNTVIEKLDKQIKYFRKLAKMKKEGVPEEKIVQEYYDLDRIKSIQIRRILENFGIQVQRNFFKRRNEKSASTYIYENQNRWTDFGEGNKSGDNIDLYQELSGCTFKEALKELTYLI